MAEILGRWAGRTWYILGNHDSDREGYLLSHWGRMEDRNLHGRAQTVASMRLAGLGGVFRSQVWYPPDPPKWRNRADLAHYTKPARRFMHGPALRDWTSIFPEDVATLSCLQADILVTHEAPTTHRYGLAVIDDLAQSMGVGLIIHGHHHDPAYEAELPSGARVVGLGIREMMEIG